MKDKEAWAIIGQFLVDFRQIAGMCWEGLEAKESSTDALSKILDYIGSVGKRKPKLLYAGEWDTTREGSNVIELMGILEYPQRAYVIVIEREPKE